MPSKVEGSLAGRKINLAGVDLTRARSKNGEGKFLTHAVREALADAPRVPALGQAELSDVAKWIATQLKGKQVSPTAVTAACSAAVSCLTAQKRQVTKPPVTVDENVVNAAMTSAVQIRAARIASRQGNGQPRVAKKKGK